MFLCPVLCTHMFLCPMFLCTMFLCPMFMCPMLCALCSCALCPMFMCSMFLCPSNALCYVPYVPVPYVMCPMFLCPMICAPKRMPYRKAPETEIERFVATYKAVDRFPPAGKRLRVKVEKQKQRVATMKDNTEEKENVISPFPLSSLS